jgi:7-carboxy-7-deazaguanine synthase
VTTKEVSIDTLSVSEVFGPTIQGEGPSQGKCVVFLRLGLCNLDCKWCDTPYTWDWTGKNGTAYDKATELKSMGLHDIAQQIETIAQNKTRTIVVTGGEPLVQQKRLAKLLTMLAQSGFRAEIETNGTVMPNEVIQELARAGHVSFNCSPKLENSGIEIATRIKADVLSCLAQLPSSFKFVVQSNQDIDEVRNLVDTHLASLDSSLIYLMPEGITADAIQNRLEWAFEKATEHGWSLSPRLHVLAYNDKRGV